MLNFSYNQIKNNNKKLEIKNTITEINNDFDVLISRMDMADKIITRFEDMSIESS